MKTKKSIYIRKREREEAALAVEAPDGAVTKCHEDFAYAYGVVGNILEGDEQPLAA